MTNSKPAWLSFVSSFSLLCCITLLPLDAVANDFDLPRILQPPVGEPEADSAYWQETVDRALGELESENPQARRAAVMVLGKYPAVEARNGVLLALEDPVADVRLAALVSLFESPRFYTGETAEKVVRLISDPEASIRRIASNNLPMILSGFPIRFTPGHPSPVRTYPDELESILRRAFQDDDVTVRRNMVAQMQNLLLLLPQTTLISLLHDSDREVAIQSLRSVRNQLPSERFVEEAQRLTQRPDRLFRIELARILASYPLPPAREALEMLGDDEDSEVAIEAVLALFQQDRSAELYERLVEKLKNQTPPQATLQRVIRAAATLGDPSKPYLEEWLEHSSAAIRLDALAHYVPIFSGDLDATFFIRFLQDPSRDVRNYILEFLQRNPLSTEAAILQALPANPYPEVRRAAAGFSTFLPSAVAEEILFELILDDVTPVRAAALQEIGNRRIRGWEEILGFSLNDSEPLIQAAAIGGLMQTVTPQTLELLRAFSNERPQSPLQARIKIHLDRYDSTNSSGQ